MSLEALLDYNVPLFFAGACGVVASAFMASVFVVFVFGVLDTNDSMLFWVYKLV